METITKDNIAVLLEMPLDDLLCKANEVRKANIGERLEQCGILSARAGLCSEDCKFCAQSARYNTNVPVHPLKETEQIVEAAKRAKANGAEKFGIVTSGNRLTDEEVKIIGEAVSRINKDVGISACASLGALGKKHLEFLKKAGLSRYHHNIETSRRFYSAIVSTHDFDERINTIKAAKEIGLEVCSGGIIGMGESWDDRINMAYTLKELDVDSVPINILLPIPGTPLENVEPLSREDVIRTICIFRIILKNKTIKIAAGREAALKESQIEAFMAGANGMIIGGYLTVNGDALESDYALIKEIKKRWTE